jgi:signal transduction histidine kinase
MITLNDAAAAVEGPGQARDAVLQASEVGRQALDEMHRMLNVLRDSEATSYQPQPDLAELPALVSMVRSAGLAVELTTTGNLATIPATAQLALYRIVQESLTNILKHGRNVERVTVAVTRRGSTVDICVHNDGSPALAPTNSPLGHGLSGMEERARLFGGHVLAGPQAAGGWMVQADLELKVVAQP